jgi:hypothetical protein
MTEEKFDEILFLTVYWSVMGFMALDITVHFLKTKL